MESLIEKQEEKFEANFRDVLLCDGNFERALGFIKKVRKESIEFERERILRIIKEMPDTFPELESDSYDLGYKEAKEYILIKLK